MTILIIKIIVVKIFIIIITITIITIIIMKWELRKQKPLRIINLQVAVARISTSRSVDQERSQSEQCFLAGNASTNSTGTHHVFFCEPFLQHFEKNTFHADICSGSDHGILQWRNTYFKTHSNTNFTKLQQKPTVPASNHTHPARSYAPNQIIPTQPNHTVTYILRITSLPQPRCPTLSDLFFFT